MAKLPRIPKSQDDLKRELIDQIQLLQHACRSFDGALEAVGKHLATSIRVLVHQHGQSRALLDQLGLLSLAFVNTAEPIDPDNLVASMPLLAIQITAGEGSKYIPLIATGGGPRRPAFVAFVNWWNDPVMKDNNGTFSRKQLVLNVANTDGGAHVDAGLDQAYDALSRRNSLGWTFTDGVAEGVPVQGRPELACMRQIAHELLMTIAESGTEYARHSDPVVPPNA